MSETKAAPQAKTVEVVLAKDHTHAGKPYKAGEKIHVSESDRDWLVANEVIAGAPAKEPGK
jgi:hypothetical protein